jgi:putative DNA primase/helicase
MLASAHCHVAGSRGGCNGKGTFIDTLVGIWGDYAATAPIETFTESITDRHPTELARVRGVRLVIAEETDEPGSQRSLGQRLKA